MKKIINNVNSCLLLVLLAVVAITQFGCKKTQEYSTATPVITGIRNYVASPGDSVLTRVGTGQWVVVRGQNLKGALQIYFDGIKASFNDAWFSDTTAIVLIPSIIAFPTVAANQLNTIRYVTNHGETTFTFTIVAPPPTINSVSNEEANPGDSVTISGFNFFFINSIVYAGKPVTGFKGSNDGTSIRMAVPAGVTSTGGFITITTASGTATSTFAVHDLVTGMLCNFDNVNNYSYGATIRNDATLFPGNTGYYAEMYTTAPIGTFDYAWYNSNRSINLNPVQWVPQANLSDPVANYALKFEVSITKPWQGATLMIRRDENTWLFLARYEPWKVALKPYTTSGWTTVVIPLLNFKSKSSAGEGTGNSAADLTTLINSTGKRPLVFMLVNDQNVAGVTPVDVAVDNIRIVKIK